MLKYYPFEFVLRSIEEAMEKESDNYFVNIPVNTGYEIHPDNIKKLEENGYRVEFRKDIYYINWSY